MQKDEEHDERVLQLVVVQAIVLDHCARPSAPLLEVGLPLLSLGLRCYSGSSESSPGRPPGLVCVLVVQQVAEEQRRLDHQQGQHQEEAKTW